MYIIAEIGINHNGSIKKALKMIKVAKVSNASAIKFQTYKTDDLISNTKKKYRYKNLPPYWNLKNKKYRNFMKYNPLFEVKEFIDNKNLNYTHYLSEKKNGRIFRVKNSNFKSKIIDDKILKLIIEKNKINLIIIDSYLIKNNFQKK